VFALKAVALKQWSPFSRYSPDKKGLNSPGNACNQMRNTQVSMSTSLSAVQQPIEHHVNNQSGSIIPTNYDQSDHTM
jgi:hypothetical protein